MHLRAPQLRMLYLQNNDVRKLPDWKIRAWHRLLCKGGEPPTALGAMTRMRVLSLRSNDRLTTLPGLDKLLLLRVLDLSWCGKLTKLPAGFGNLSALQKLNLSWCNKLTELPAGFGNLSALTGLMWSC